MTLKVLDNWTWWKSVLALGLGGAFAGGIIAWATEKDRFKRKYMREWVEAVTAHGGFGSWHFETAWEPGEVQDILIESVESPVAEI